MNYSILESAERKEKLRGEGKVELPLTIDTKKYVIWNISYRDIFITLPFAAIGVVIILILYLINGKLAPNHIIIAFAPAVSVLVFLLIPHPSRKNLSFLQYQVWWKIQFNRRQRRFFYTKGGIDVGKGKKKQEKDIREALEVKNVYNDCYETVNTLVKVIEVSSVNLSHLPKRDRDMIYQSYETFLNDKPKDIDLQIAKIAQPVNLKSYYNHYREMFGNEQDYAKKLIQQGYLNMVEQIQKSKSMVTQKRYVIISKKYTEATREKVIASLTDHANNLVKMLENMLSGHYKLSAYVLNNDQLFELIYTCIDYENAQVNMSFQSSTFLPMSIGPRTSEEMKERWEEETKYKII